MMPRVVIAFCALLVASCVHAQHAFQQLREFGFVERSASQPLGGLTEGPDNWLYGTSQGGEGGVIYRVKKDGTGFSIIFDFAGTNGTPSRGQLIRGSDGALYGTVILPDTFDGAVYRIQPDGAGFTLYNVAIGGQTISGVIEGRDGRLYGTTLGGGVFEGGTAFGINKDGTGFALLHNFAGGPLDGHQPVAEPMEGSDGQLYIVTAAGGTGDAGVICRLNKNGSSFLLLHHFPAVGTNDGRIPNGRLVQGPGGYLYGTTEAGGIGGEEDVFAGFGVVFRVSADGDIYSVLRRFEGEINDGRRPRHLFVGSDAQLYGTCQNAGYADQIDGIFRMDTSGNNFSLIYTWVTGDNQTIQLNPVNESADGNLYGTSAAGGASNIGQAFKLRLNGTQYQTLHEFSSVGGDGRLPWALIRDDDGTLYGSTLAGGANDTGTLYKLDGSGNYTILHHFGAQSGSPLSLIAASDGLLYGSAYYSSSIFRMAKDGSSYTVLTNLSAPPTGGLIEGSDFLLYGVTDSSIFRLNADGTDLHLVYAFSNVLGAAVAPAGILEDSDGKLYGTALRGGSSNQGMVFKLNKDGSQFEIMYSFVAPIGTLVYPNPLHEASDGYLYGTTYRGGGDGEGIIYRISKSGAYQFINAFADDNGNPVGQLDEGPGGWLYGVTQESGNFSGGHLFRFKIGATSPIYILHHFGEGSLGRNPGTGVVFGGARELYGTTQDGGFGFGTIFRLDVIPLLSIARAGSALEISWAWNGTDYDLVHSENLASPWTFVNSGITNSGGRVTATVQPTGSRRFFRLTEPPPLPGAAR